MVSEQFCLDSLNVSNLLLMLKIEVLLILMEGDVWVACSGF